MTAYKQNKRLMFTALAIMAGAFLFFMPPARTFAGTSDAAAIEVEADSAFETESESVTVLETESESPLTVKEVWLTGDTLNISVMDDGAEGQTFELNLSDYAMPGDEYVTVQATDESGRESNSITFKNPYYQSGAAGEQSQSAVPEGSVPENAGSPFTPDGAGSVVDNATETDGKEFFTVETPDGNTFYLIVDRQRGGENVYLLDAVTENDLASLAKPGDGSTVSAVEPVTAATPAPVEATPAPAQEPENGAANAVIFTAVCIVVILIGCAVYYFLAVCPKKNSGAESDFEPEDYEDEEMDVEDDEDGEDV